MFLDENGQLIDQNQSLVKGAEVARLLDKYGLNWTVEKQEMLLPSGTKTGLYATVRSDNEAVFGSFKEGYTVYQNEELAELVLKVADVIGATTTNGGMFKGGGKVFLQVQMDDKQVANDRVKRLATAINSFDGSTALRWGGTGITISCANTFHAAYRQLDNSVRHTSNMREAIERSLRILEDVQEAETTLYEMFNRMANESAKQEHINRVIREVTKVDVTMTPKEAKEKYSTKALNNTQALVKSISKEMSYKGDNLWGLFSGVTHFTTHSAGREKTREESKISGSLQKTDQTVYDILAEVVS